ncbi:MAG: dockerin type I domain-containing protein [Desulfatibacillaceae bacterium]
MDLSGALEPVDGTNQDNMTLATNGDIHFSGGMFWLQSENVGIVVRSPVTGDVDRDAVVDVADAILAVQSMSGKASGVQSAPADVNRDGKVDVSETNFVLQVISGLRSAE